MMPVLRRPWLGFGLLAAVVLVVTAIAVVPDLMDNTDDCDRATSFAQELGLDLSDSEAVVSCVWSPGFGDFSGALTVRTRSAQSRGALLARSGVSVQPHNHGQTREDTGTRHEFTSRTGASELAIGYDAAVESGLLLEVAATNL